MNEKIKELIYERKFPEDLEDHLLESGTRDVIDLIRCVRTVLPYFDEMYMTAHEPAKRMKEWGTSLRVWSGMPEFYENQGHPDWSGSSDRGLFESVTPWYWADREKEVVEALGGKLIETRKNPGANPKLSCKEVRIYRIK